MSEEKSIQEQTLESVNAGRNWAGLSLAIITATMLILFALLGFGQDRIIDTIEQLDSIEPMPSRTARSSSLCPQPANSSFEGEYVEWGQRVIVADSWTPFHWDRESMIGGGSSGDSALPEYKPITTDIDPRRVRTGEKAQCWFWFYTHGDAGVWEKVFLPPGKYAVKAYFQAWVSDDDNPNHSPGEMYASIGIDTEGRGGTGWPWETSVSWSPFELVREEYVEVQSRIFYLEEAGDVTIYLRTWKKWDQKHGDAYVDDVEVLCLAEGGTPQPTHTPVPIFTPCPTQTTLPTFTPIPTSAVPTATPEQESGVFYMPDGTQVQWIRNQNGDRCYETESGGFACVK